MMVEAAAGSEAVAHCSENPALLRKWGYKISLSLALAGCFVIEPQRWWRCLRRRLLGFLGG